MKKIILYIIGVFAIMACSNDRDSLNDMVSEMNNKLPKEEKHWTVDSMGVSNKGEIVYYCNSDKDAEYFDLLKSKKDSITDAIIANLNNGKENNTMKLVKKCKEFNAGIVYKYSSKKTNETLTINIPLNKLIVDPERD